MLRLVVFDCDGVMFSSREANRQYYNDLLNAFSCAPMTEAELDYVHIHNVQASIAYIFSRHGHIELQQVRAYCAELEYAPYLAYMRMEPDLPDFLAAIRPPLHSAISTNRTNTMELILSRFGLAASFDMVVTAQNAPRPKPAPDGLWMILDRFHVQPQEAIYIGDSVVDEQHCAQVGVTLIAFRNPLLKAAYHVNSFTDILRLGPFRDLQS